MSKMTTKKKVWEILKAAAESFSTAAGVTVIAFTIINVFIPISLVITIPICGVVGIIAGVVGGYYKYHDISSKEKKEEDQARREQEQKEKDEIIVQTEKKLLDITNELETDLQYLKVDLVRNHNSGLSQSTDALLLSDSAKYSRNSQTFFSDSRPKTTVTRSASNDAMFKGPYKYTKLEDMDEAPGLAMH